MASWGSQVIAEMVTRLRVAPPPEVRVKRFPTREGGGSQIGVYGLTRTSAPVGGGSRRPLTHHGHLVILELRIEQVEGDGETDPSPDEAVDALYVHAITKLFADRTLGGRVQTIEERRSEWKHGPPGEKLAAVLHLTLEVFYQTRADNPEERT